MRVLIDTYILISALLRGGLPESVILWVLNNPEWEWLVSPSILDEYRDVLQRKKFKFTDEFVNRWLELLNDGPLPPEAKEHALQGEWRDFRELHLGGDSLLIYQTDAQHVCLTRPGSHAQLFKSM